MKRRFQVAMTVVLVVGVSAAVLYANVMLQFSPGIPGSGVPAYARIEKLSEAPALVHHTEKWAAITFYRTPSCVPAGFNLLDFFDAPGAFDCTLTVEGFEIWRNGPLAGDLSPIQTESFGLGAVPIWFVDWDQLQDAMEGGLTMTELAALPSLRIGSASFFKETLHPSGGAQRTKTQIVARGTWSAVEDGSGAFFFQVEETNNQLKHVAIEFK